MIVYIACAAGLRYTESTNQTTEGEFVYAQADFERNTLRALRGGVPERPALFELFLNDTMYRHFAGRGPEVGAT